MTRYFNSMSNRAYAALITIIFMVVFLVTLFMMAAGGASAVVVEAPDRVVEQVELTYAEPVPTRRLPYRVYFETNDGAAYRYVNYRVCARANEVTNTICQFAFWPGRAHS